MPQPKTPSRSKQETSADAQHSEAALDEALDESFPASDPVAISVDRERSREPERGDSRSKRTR